MRRAGRLHSTGGGNLQVWAERLAPLPHPQFYLFDREHGPEADRRQAAVAVVQESADRVVLLSSKRSLETISIGSASPTPSTSTWSSTTSTISRSGWRDRF